MGEMIVVRRRESLICLLPSCSTHLACPSRQAGEEYEDGELNDDDEVCYI